MIQENPKIIFNHSASGSGQIKPTVVEGSRKPRNGKGFTWKAIFGDPNKRWRITKWLKVSTNSGDSEDISPMAPNEGLWDPNVIMPTGGVKDD